MIMPLTDKTTEQIGASLSTPEAEVTALNMAVGPIGMPALDSWEAMLGRKSRTVMLDGVETSIVVVKMV